MHVPFIDLVRQYKEIQAEVDTAISQVFARGSFTNDQAVRDFENAFGALHASGECVAVSNGTAALYTALQAAGIGPGDEVILPAHTFISTALAVSQTGATPVFVDCDPDYFLIDVNTLEAHITPNTRAIIVVHLYGQMADMEEIQKIAAAHQLILIEDCAQAHLAVRNNILAGTSGNIGCFSFYPVKNLGAFGEGGAVISKDKEFTRKVGMLRTYGASDKYTYSLPGFNFRMSEIQGAVLKVKLGRLETWNDRRRQMAAHYSNRLSEVEQLILPKVMTGNRHVFHLFVIRTRQRDALREYLSEKNIITGIHYPRPCHLQPVYAHLGYGPGSLPVTEQLCGEILSLPVSEQLTETQADYVCDTIRAFFSR